MCGGVWALLLGDFEMKCEVVMSFVYVSIILHGNHNLGYQGRKTICRVHVSFEGGVGGNDRPPTIGHSRICRRLVVFLLVGSWSDIDSRVGLSGQSR